MPRYLLARHSYVCEAGGYGVFLDLKRDRYTAVFPRRSCNAASSYRRLAASPSAANHTLTLAASSTRDVVEALLSEGLIIADSSTGKAATPSRLDEPTASLWDFPRSWPQLSAQHLRNLISARLETTQRLRAFPISSIVNRLRARDARRGRQDARDRERATTDDGIPCPSTHVLSGKRCVLAKLANTHRVPCKVRCACNVCVWCTDGSILGARVAAARRSSYLLSPLSMLRPSLRSWWCSSFGLVY